MAYNLSVVATQQGIKHFRNMKRFRFLTTGGTPTETLTLPGMDVNAGAYIKVIPDPNSQVMAADLIEIKASRSNSNSQIVIGSSDGTNIAANIACELVYIERQMGDGSSTSRQLGNTEDTIFGVNDEAGSVTFNPNGGSAVVDSTLVTQDSIVWVDQKSQLTGLTGGLCELNNPIGSRTSGVSFLVGRANSTDSPNGNVTFDWVVFQI